MLNSKKNPTFGDFQTSRVVAREARQTACPGFISAVRGGTIPRPLTRHVDNVHQTPHAPRVDVVEVVVGQQDPCQVLRAARLPRVVLLLVVARGRRADAVQVAAHAAGERLGRLDVRRLAEDRQVAAAAAAALRDRRLALRVRKVVAHQRRVRHSSPGPELETEQISNH